MAEATLHVVVIQVVAEIAIITPEEARLLIDAATEGMVQDGDHIFTQEAEVKLKKVIRKIRSAAKKATHAS